MMYRLWAWCSYLRNDVRASGKMFGVRIWGINCGYGALMVPRCWFSHVAPSLGAGTSGMARAYYVEFGCGVRGWELMLRRQKGCLKFGIGTQNSDLMPRVRFCCPKFGFSVWTSASKSGGRVRMVSIGVSGVHRSSLVYMARGVPVPATALSKPLTYALSLP